MPSKQSVRCSYVHFVKGAEVTMTQGTRMLTAYDDLEDKLKVRSSTLKALVLLFSTSFDDRKPSNP